MEEAMISRDYTQEIGLPAGEQPVSRPVTIVVLALVALAGVAIVWQIFAQMPASQPAPEPVKVTRR
jgi:hypothetical protein